MTDTTELLQIEPCPRCGSTKPFKPATALPDEPDDLRKLINPKVRRYIDQLRAAAERLEKENNLRKRAGNSLTIAYRQLQDEHEKAEVAVEVLTKDCEKAEAKLGEALALLVDADRLYSNYGLIANDVDCGRWANSVRAMIDTQKKDKTVSNADLYLAHLKRNDR